MPENKSQNLPFYWSTRFVRALYKEGVRNVIISPGSRSTPLTLAFSVHMGFNPVVILDERSAAFTALGMAKYTGIPTVLVCTSGTALANYYPAVLEAKNSGIPLIIASADRPPHLRDNGASQTIDQVKIFGDNTVFFHEVGEPSEEKSKQKRIDSLAHQAFEYSTKRKGVAHLNFAFDKPLEPDYEFLQLIEKENNKNLNVTSVFYKAEENKISFDEKFWSQIISAEHPLIIVGPNLDKYQIDAIQKLSRLLDSPILAEPGSNLPSSKYTIEGFDGFLKNLSKSNNLGPDLILRFGEVPVSKALNQFIELYEDRVQLSFMKEFFWLDGGNNPTKYVVLNGEIEVPETSTSSNTGWLKLWKAAEKSFKTFRSENVFPTSPLSDGYVFHSISKEISSKSFTFLSNSFPVRDMSLFGKFDGKEMYVNRGAAGIDGITSTAMGISLASQKPGVLFIGDLAFLHDSNALLSSKYITNPLVIIILNNGGGSIFRMLPVHKIKEKYTTYFETPQDVKISALCRAHEVDHTLVTRVEQLLSTFERNYQNPGIHVIEVLTDPDTSMDLRNKLWDFNFKDA